MAEQIKAYYSELAKIGPTQDWEKILKVTKKILGLSVNEKKAFKTKIVCLIHLDRFEEALTSMRNNVDSENDLVFEKAYCQYRLNQINDAYSTIKNSNSAPSIRVNELLAQICYKLEKYHESYDLYREIIKNTDDDYEIERQTNLSAVVAALKLTEPTSTKEVNMAEYENKTYELCYNSACILIGKGNYQEAKEKLRKAEKMCLKTFEEEDDQETAESEIAIIRIQLAFCLQKLGDYEESLKIYNNSLKSKSEDISINAVASNNLVCLNKDQNIFDSKKKFKAATGPELEQKMNKYQKKLISFNEILFSIITNQNDAANKLLNQFESKFEDKEKYILLKAALLYREKKFAEAEKYLKDLIGNSVVSSNKIQFYLLQVYLIQGKYNEAIDLIKTTDASKVFKLGMISALVTLLSNKNDEKGITTLFNNAIEFYSKINLNANELEVLVRENSNFQIANDNLKNASEMLEKMRAMKPKDYKILSKLIEIYSKINEPKAKELSKDLPTLEDIVANSNIDIDSIENQFNLMTSKYSRMKLTTQLKSPEASKSKNQEKEVEKKKKKKRKVKLPKNYDPNKPLDPERWHPLRERSYYKGKRNKKKNQVGKGTQGAVGSAKDNSDIQQSPKQEATRVLPERPTGPVRPKGNVKKRRAGKW